MKEQRSERRILSSTVARIIAFFVLAISVVVAVGSGFGSIFLWEEDAFTSGVMPVIKDVMQSKVVWDDVNYLKTLYQEGDTLGMEAYLERRNIAIEIYENAAKTWESEENVLLWSNYNGFDTRYTFNCFTDILVESAVKVFTEEQFDAEDEYIDEDGEDQISYGYVEEERDILFRVYVDDTFHYEDEYQMIHAWGMVLEECLYLLPIVAVISVLCMMIAFIFLMCSAGHHRGQEGISGGVLYFFHFDIVTAVFVCVAAVGFVFIVEILSYGSGSIFEILVALLLTVLEVVWCTIYCMDLAVELKKGTIFRNTLIYTVLRACGKGIKALGRGLLKLFRGLPLVTGVVIVYIAFCAVQFFSLAFFCVLWNMDGDVLVLCFLEKLILFPAVLYFALVCKKLQQGSEALADGQLSFKLDTSNMLLGFKEHGENLNRIGEGIAVAVDERMKSEHLKTELITNVSHDLKTPLTSIINYADLIGTAVSRGEQGEQEQKQLAEYSEVLVRQSRRLKKLLEDLVEASKATTGNLEVKLETCEISVILSQAIGEYMQRFSEKELVLLVRQPEEPIYIQADGRHLWRVFDNLLNNICKYAQESTRVYLTVEPKGESVEIVFRNMSKYQLEVSAEELQERFVRGDKSRHMEGNGLGLSIAGSLVELQGGTMEIVTDGDLFKVILRFPQEH